MRIRRWAGILVMAAGMALAGCQTLYNPGLPQVPLMMGGDETQIALNGGTNGYGLQLAYSPYYHWVITTNGSTFNTYLDMQFKEKYLHKQGEIGTGYYTALSKLVRVEVLGGIGGSSSGVNENRNLLRRAYIQPSAGISTQYFDAGITSRFSFVQHYLDKSAAGETARDLQVAFWEPSLMLRAGYEQLKFNVQLGWAVPMGQDAIPFRSPMIGGGVHVTLFRDFDRFIH